jgi:hypothetical protein
MVLAHRAHLRRHGWIALLAIWALALLPTLSQALASATGERAWAEVCTAQGTRWVALDDAAPEPGPASVLEHCPFCGGTPALGLPPVPAAWRLAAADHEQPITAGVAAPKPLAGLQARPRGPPFSFA